MVVEKKRPLQSSNNVNIAPPPGGKTIEEMYQKKSQLEHILLRPDTYIGSIEKHTQTLWVYENDEMVSRSVSYVPGLYKIFDEILVNAADNKQRDPSMNSLKVEIDVEMNSISVYNNGDGVPVEIHQEEQVYVPEMIFGHLLTSSNYDDKEKKTTGGRNGYGAKLTNIFSTEFVIETADGKRQKKYKQVFTNNMGKKSDPVITKCKASDNWTKVTFKPDLAKFNMTHLENDVVALMKKRVFDMAGCLGSSVKVELDGNRVPVKSFLDYVDLYLRTAQKSDATIPRITERVNDRWEVCVSLSDGQFQQVSFVNSIATIKGGTHVDHVTSQITNHVMTVVNKKNKNANLKAHNVKNYLWVFVNALIDNPAFDSQTKETLTIRPSSFGSKCELPPEFLKKVAKSGIVDSLLSWANFKQNKDLKKTDGTKTERVHNINKLEDANEAGGRNSEKCTLILTEGDSAKALAMAGLSVVGRDHYGVFPLRGKLLNVREASATQVRDNEEIKNIKRILGLQQDKQYANVKSLRYGHLMIMTDQDHDGSHIKGLLINFIHSFWPSLLKIPSFLVEFITPIVKATNKNGNELAFYTMPEYEAWKESLRGNANGWTIKYYKGLGTSTSKEGRDYFQNLDMHKKDFMWVDEKDGEAIELAFSKKKIEERKCWLRKFEPGTHLDQKEKLIKYRDFVHKELILFSLADLQRSIPSMVDGLKPGQRKILFCSFKRNFVKEAKVAQFSGYVSEHSAYHHGEASLAGTIIGMAQDYVGSNNINLLQPNGQFGTRNLGGKDHASARYIYTKLSPITRTLFPKDDDILLDYLDEDGQSIEPTWYVPVIPTVLVNGSEGIGTGWSSYIPNYNPRDIVANIRNLINGEEMVPMAPWYRGFKGTIEKSSKDGSYNNSGVLEEINETTIRISELPVRRWTQDYKEFLESVTRGNDKAKDPFIEGFTQHSDHSTVDILVHMTEENMMAAKQDGLLKKFKLTTSLNTSNMHLFDANGLIKKYDTPEQILEEFFHIRLAFYVKRKKVLLDNLELDLLKLENKVRFILGVVKGEIVVSNRKRADLFIELQQKGFTPFPKKTKAVEPEVAGATDATDDNEDDAEAAATEVRIGDYEYLLSMAIGTLTLEKVQALLAEQDKLNSQVDELRKATPTSLWAKDLDNLESELNDLEKSDALAEELKKNAKGQIKKGAVAASKVSRAAPKAPRKNTKKAANAEAVEQITETFNSAMDIEKPPEKAKPKARAAPKKAAAAKKKVVVSDDDDDDEVLELKDRLAAYNLDSSPDKPAEAPEVAPAPKKAAPKRAAAKKKALPDVDLVDLDDEVDEDDDDDFEMETGSGSSGGNKKGGNKKGGAAAAAKAKPKAAAKAPAKRRGGAAAAASKQSSQLLGQKFLTDMLKPADESSGISPEKKVRKMRESPFNKKSGSLLGRTTIGNIGIVEEDGDDEYEDASNGSGEKPSSSSSSEAASAEVVFPAAKARPLRANRKQMRYVLSDSESEKPSGDSEFDESESESDVDFDEE
ncbi:DNA topoisomerase 2 isoform X1 [Cannabis sativa]|uniref:DNA topoisomerase 2 isoform X1 n=1 Tax=Cannabis sativa TaxID=3483 RepID=UPI0029CA4EB5|nr:DNA topoisomerase 2 isoform X1 [Cannabis sativa]